MRAGRPVWQSRKHLQDRAADPRRASANPPRKTISTPDHARCSGPASGRSCSSCAALPRQPLVAQYPHDEGVVIDAVEEVVLPLPALVLEAEPFVEPDGALVERVDQQAEPVQVQR